MSAAEATGATRTPMLFERFRTWLIMVAFVVIQDAWAEHDESRSAAKTRRFASIWTEGREG